MRNRILIGRLVALTCVSALGLAACSSSDAKPSAGPIKLALLASTSKQDTFASPGQVEGAQFAVKKLNAGGGIGGRQVELAQYRMPTDANLALSNLLKAAEAKPAAMFGLPLSSTAQTLAARVAQLQIPFIYFNAVPSAYKTGPNGSPWAFFMRSDNSSTMQAGLASFLAKNPTVKSAGLLCLATATGTDLCGGAEKALSTNSVRIVAKKTINVEDTDFTNPALAMKGADVVILTVTPGQVPTVAKALKSNGLNPLLFGSAAIAALPPGSLSADVLPKLSGVVDCIPNATGASAESTEWATSFKAEYGFVPNFFAAESYDAVMVAAQAIKTSGSTDAKSVAKALSTQPVYKGVCSEYAANDKQILNKKSVIATFDADGALQPGDAVEVP